MQNARNADTTPERRNRWIKDQPNKPSASTNCIRHCRRETRRASNKKLTRKLERRKRAGLGMQKDHQSDNDGKKTPNDDHDHGETGD